MSMRAMDTMRQIWLDKFNNSLKPHEQRAALVELDIECRNTSHGKPCNLGLHGGEKQLKAKNERMWQDKLIEVAKRKYPTAFR